MADYLYGLSDTGRIRTNNEDAFVALHLETGRTLACVIDGVGGYEGGEVAAALAREKLSALAAWGEAHDEAALAGAFVAAAAAIVAAKRENEALHAMACVLTAVITDEKTGTFHYAHVGDTRLYLFRDGSLVKISHDHSFVGLLEDSGRLREAEAMAHPKRNEVDRALGFGAGIEDPFTYIEQGYSPFLPGDLLLLCSDGLSDMLTSNEITLLLQEGRTLAEKCKALVAAANRKGGKDNITVVLVAHSKERRQAKPVGAPRVAAVPVAPAKETGNKAVPEPIASAARPRRWPLIAGGCLLLLLVLWFLVRRPAREPDIAVNEAAPLRFDELLLRSRDTVRLRDGGAAGVVLPDSMLIGHDTLVVLGAGAVLQPAGRHSILQVAPTVGLLSLSHLELRNTDIRISNSNIGALRFDSVRLVNVSIGVAQPIILKDTMLSGSFYNAAKKGGKHE
jgi:serine/threonine protein phosphatase PrpC